MNSAGDTARRIRAKRRGNSLGFGVFKTALRVFGLRGAYGLLYLVCLHYTLFDRAAVRAAAAYLARRFPGRGRMRLRWDVYRLFVSQGRQLIDRYALMTGAVKFEIRMDGEERLRETLDQGGGFVLLTAHVGNWQTVMGFLQRLDRKVNLVMRPEDNPAVQESLQLDSADDKVGLISPEGYLGGVVEAMNALGRGEVVSLMGDRSYGFSPVAVEFLGSRAGFASGAFHLAAMAGCPVVTLLSAKTGLKQYDLAVAALWRPRYDKGLPKQEQLRGWVQDFAHVLESFVRRHPFQCFLFHDVWADAPV